MQTSHSSQTIKFKKGRKLSDASLLHGFKNSPIWKLLFFKPSEAFWMLLIQYLEANAQLVSYLYTAVTRCRHGQLVCGLVLTGMGLSFGLAFNSTHVWPGLAPFAAFAVPVLPFFKDADELYQLAAVDIHSPALLIYCGVFVLSSLVHIGMCWFGAGSENDGLRGYSYIYLLIDRLLGKYVKVGQFFIQFLEALLFITIAGYLWYQKIDPYFGSFVIIISVNELFLLLSEKSRAMHIKPLIQA